MLRSMTGQGQARAEGPLGTMSVEVRSVNNRHLKLTSKLGEHLLRLEPRIERTVRHHVQRGTIQVHAIWHRTDVAAPFEINRAMLAAYYRQISQLRAELGAGPPVDLSQLVSLPGVVEESEVEGADADVIWQVFHPVLEAALQNLDLMRRREGDAMEEQLLQDLTLLQQHAIQIRQLAPSVLDAYRHRLRSRLQAALREYDAEVDPAVIVRELQLYADRCDISEELTRLDSHCEMFRRSIAQEAAAGRKLDFVTQELFRETNTIGSKASDATISSHVVEMKCAIERMRELVQNIE
jgi:uncharacterized protein (TIGR00255 family)